MTTTHNEKSLLNCPFCGGEAQTDYWDMGKPMYTVNCRPCSAMCYSYESEDMAIKDWNNRPTPPPAHDVSDAIEDLEKGLNGSAHTPLHHYSSEIDILIRAAQQPAQGDNAKALEIAINALNKINHRSMGTAGNIAGAAIKEIKALATEGK